MWTVQMRHRHRPRMSSCKHVARCHTQRRLKQAICRGYHGTKSQKNLGLTTFNKLFLLFVQKLLLRLLYAMGPVADQAETTSEQKVAGKIFGKFVSYNCPNTYCRKYCVFGYQAHSNEQESRTRRNREHSERPSSL